MRRAFAKDDRAFLRYYLFCQLFPEFNKSQIPQVAENLSKALFEIKKQLEYPLKEKFLVRIKRQAPVFIILSDVLKKYQGRLTELLSDSNGFANAVFLACGQRYAETAAKVRRTIVRSIIFLVLTKVLFAFAVEGAYDNYIYGHLQVRELLINIIVPPILLIVGSFFIKTPNVDNSRSVLKRITQVLFEEKPHLWPVLRLYRNPPKGNVFMSTTFALLWLATFVFSFGSIVWGLNRLNFNPVSQAVFLFFIAIVSFLSYRITQIARGYTIDTHQGLLTPFIDLLLIPIVNVGMRLTDGIAVINPLILVFDFLIEAPFKTIFGFFDQLFSYLHTKRETLE